MRSDKWPRVLHSVMSSTRKVTAQETHLGIHPSKF